MYAAFDPGPDLGWSVFDTEGKFKASGIVRELTSQPVFLQAFHKAYPNIKTVISEIWTMYDHKAILTKFAKETIMSEGMVMCYAKAAMLEYVPQPSEILTIGQKWTGLKIKKGAAHRDSHDTSARIHGEYYLIKNKIKELTL